MLSSVAALFWGMYSSFKVLKLDHDHDKHVVDAKLGVGARERDGGREARAAAGPRAVQVAAEDYDDDEGQEAMRRGEESLMYWVFLALLSLYNKYFEILFFWLPFYYEAKVLFLCLFMVPYFGVRWLRPLARGCLFRDSQVFALLRCHGICSPRF